MGGSKRTRRLPQVSTDLTKSMQEGPKCPSKDELPDVFIQFVSTYSSDTSISEPPRKRHKPNQDTQNCEDIIVRRTQLVVEFPDATIDYNVIERTRVPILVTVVESSPSTYHLEIYDIENKSNRLILDLNITAIDLPLRDINIANNVVIDALHWQSPQGQGRLWTETDVRLSRKKDGSQYLELLFTIRWNITTSLDNVPRRRVKRPALQACLDAYFDFSRQYDGQNTDPWSPQNFYESVHVPKKEDDIAHSTLCASLETNLYPFQKRSVRWLLERESVQWSSVKRSVVDLPPEVKARRLPYSFHQATDENGEIIYISPFLNVVTKDVIPYRQLEAVRGGMICEEMGLGKTVEIIALINLHRRARTSTPILDPYILGCMQPTPATLIITPSSILSQWMAELALHSPNLRVMHYEGIKAYKHSEVARLINRLANHDVVLTTYNVLSSEVHYTLPPPDRPLRGEKRHAAPKSPLVQLSWWRVCLDEAQMIENGVSNAATVARLIPRINAWVITGTPVQKDVSDLLGLLVFLRLEPFVSLPHLYSTLVVRDRQYFKALFQEIALRHTKQSVRDELRLPRQQRFVITIPFTAIEEQHYQSLFQQMCEDCGLETNGSPLRDDWDLNSPAIVEQMRLWLVRLRQTALHPEVGSRNRRALGHKQGPLRTANDVLEAMLEQSEMNIRADQRALLLSKLKRGQTFENGPEVEQALGIWTEVLVEADGMVAACRQQLEKEMLANHGGITSRNEIEDTSNNETQSTDEEDSPEVSARIGMYHNRLRMALEIQHVATFFQANAYYQIKTDECITKPDSQEFKDLEKMEIEGYDRAKEIRQEILKDIFRKANRLITKVLKKGSSQAFTQIPEFPPSPPRGGIESHRIIHQLNELGVALDTQAKQLVEWREQTIKLLLRPLVDEDEGVETTGDEYEESTKTQDEVVVLVQILRTAIEDRYDALTGQENQLIKNEATNALKFAKEGEGPFPEKVIELFKIQEQVKPSKDMSLRRVISDLRALASNLKIDAENGRARAGTELSIVEHERQRVQKQYNEQNKAIVSLRQEIDVFTTLMNTRLEYYRQLQELSDMVAPLEEGENHRIRDQLIAEEGKLAKKIATLNAKRRYLIHLRNEATADPTEQRMCIICQSTFEIGALTICGHQFCKECMGYWWNAHHNCPVCKRKLTRNDLHDITYKPQELRVAEEIIPHPGDSPRSVTKTSSIYSEISNEKLREIRGIDLDGPSFTTKIDSIARHLLWLRDSDPGAKSVIFSQFKEFLDILGRALSRFRIGFTTIDKSGGIEQFKSDPAAECFLLHAKAHSSGMNLINASHVFLCEPLINTALELQAIARVHRIGQKQATTVWLYIIDGTVEESIYEISVRRRLEHISQIGKGKSQVLTVEELDNSNSLELQNAPIAKLLTKARSGGGEIVAENDLWSCLFGNIHQGNRAHSLDTISTEISRHLGVEAAEHRRIEGNQGALDACIQK